MLKYVGTFGLVLMLCGCGATKTASGPMAHMESMAMPPAAESAPAAQANTVMIDNFAFAPATIMVAAGTTVTWVNRDDVPHTATSSEMPRVFDSGAMDTDGKYSFTFKTPGRYAYFCAVHPHMTGTIVVK